MQSRKPFSVVSLLAGLLAATLATAPARASALADANPEPSALPPLAAPLARPAALTRDAAYLRQWVMDRQDHRHQPYAIVDKKAAMLYVFDADGRLLGATEALLGAAPGDHSAPGVADGDLNQIPWADRTTPAGRFASQPGRNLTGEFIVWFDYQAALAIHRVRPGSQEARRIAGLATPTPADNRASLGCVVVAPEFYDAVVHPTLGKRRGVVYVMPETQPVQALFGVGATTAGVR